MAQSLGFETFASYMPSSWPQARIEPSEEKDMLASDEPWLVENWEALSVIVQCVSSTLVFGGVPAAVSSVIEMCWISAVVGAVVGGHGPLLAAARQGHLVGGRVADRVVVDPAGGRTVG